MLPLQGFKQPAFLYHPLFRGALLCSGRYGPEIMWTKPEASMRLAVKCGCVSAAELISPHVALAWDVMLALTYLCL